MKRAIDRVWSTVGLLFGKGAYEQGLRRGYEDGLAEHRKAPSPPLGTSILLGPAYAIRYMRGYNAGYERGARDRTAWLKSNARTASAEARDQTHRVLDQSQRTLDQPSSQPTAGLEKLAQRAVRQEVEWVERLKAAQLMELLASKEARGPENDRSR